MWLFDRLAEQRIQEAQEAGQFDDLPGHGQPLPEDDIDPLVPAELRTAYRLLKNAGYLPEEVQLRRQIQEAEDLLLAARTEEDRDEASSRLRLLLQRLGRERAATLQVDQAYYERIIQRLGAGG